VDAELFPGSSELLEAILREPGASGGGAVPITRVEASVRWRSREVGCAIRMLVRAGLLAFAEERCLPADQAVRVTSIALAVRAVQ
jgi:hypothetical protein